MRTSWLAICLVTACAADEPQLGEQQQADTVRNRFKGLEANASVHDAQTTVDIDLIINISNAAPTETFLFYQYAVADPTSQVCTDFCTFARWTTETECAAARELVSKRGVGKLCRALFNTSEFLCY